MFKVDDFSDEEIIEEYYYTDTSSEDTDSLEIELNQAQFIPRYRYTASGRKYLQLTTEESEGWEPDYRTYNRVVREYKDKVMNKPSFTTTLYWYLHVNPAIHKGIKLKPIKPYSLLDNLYSYIS